MIMALHSERPMKEPNLLTVFREYCVRAKSARHIARNHKCSKTTVINRLDLIRQRTRTEPRSLRAYSPWLSEILAAGSDPRARLINRRHLASGGLHTKHPAD